jgi:tight adherence protein C
MSLLRDLFGDLRMEDVIVLLTGFSAFFVVIAVWRSMLVRDPLSGRLKQIARRRAGLRDEMMSAKRRDRELRGGHMDFMRSVVGRFDLMKSSVTGSATERLEQAGLRARDALIAYLFMKLVLPIAAAIGSLLFFYAINPFGMTSLAQCAAALGVLALLTYAPDIYLRNTRDKRRQKLQRGLPDGLDLLVICAEAGLSLDAALHRVSGEIAKGYPEMADELALTSIELGFMPERSKALEGLARRTGLPSIRSLVNTLAQTEKYGTPLANSLRVLASEFRNERMLQAEAKAARLPATLTIPMVLFILPALFFILLGPVVLQVMDTFAGK